MPSPSSSNRPKTKGAPRYVRAATAVVTILLLGQALAGAAGAAGSAIVSATFSGGAGTALVNGTFYAKSGTALTMTVVTDTSIDCVALSGAHSATTTTPVTADATSRTWAFSLAAPSGADGVRDTTVTASSDLGCVSTDATAARSYSVDNTPPAVSGSISPQPNVGGWDTSDVTVTWSATDAGSGVASGPTPATATQTVETGGVLKSATASDWVGNVGASSLTVKLDKTAPTITGLRNPAANANGWNNSDVTVSFSCSDGRSGIKTCSSSTSFSSNVVGQPVVGSAVDFADNTSSATVIVNVDKDPPTISGSPAGSPNGAGWFDAPVTIVWACADQGGSGFSPDECADSAISAEGTGLTATRSVSDLAGNVSNPATSSPAVDVDLTAPLTTATPSSGATWSSSAVSVTLTANDALSGVASTHYRLDGASDQTYAQGDALPFATDGVHTLEYWSVDVAGNEESHHTLTVNVDKSAPDIATSQSPAANSAGWNNSSVVVSFDCSDAVSGIASCPADVAVASEGANQTVSGTAFDLAGNSASTSAAVSIDLTAPVVSVVGVVDGATYELGTYSASCSSSDALSGIAGTARLTTSGGPTGPLTLTCSGATDRAGNAQATPVSVTIVVRQSVDAYQFGGFDRPLGGGDAVNVVKAGSAVPLRFSLGGYRGMNILAAGFPATVSYVCATTPPATATEPIATNGSLSYDAGSDTYALVWKTTKSWDGCRMLQLKFSDGSVASAYFNFR